jgi:hypothetical protein
MTALLVAYFLHSHKPMDAETVPRQMLLLKRIMTNYKSDASPFELNKFLFKHQFLVPIFINALFNATRDLEFMESFRLSYINSKGVNEFEKEEMNAWCRILVPKLMNQKPFSCEYVINTTNWTSSIVALGEVPEANQTVKPTEDAESETLSIVE